MLNPMTMFDDIALSRKSTAEQVADGPARKLPLCGELGPGEPIRESAVAAFLGVSCNAVRRWMRLPERSSLITYEFNRGAVVKRLSRTELPEVCRDRQVLEVAAVRTPDPGATAVAELEHAYERLEQAAPNGGAREDRRGRPRLPRGAGRAGRECACGWLLRRAGSAS